MEILEVEALFLWILELYLGAEEGRGQGDVGG